MVSHENLETSVFYYVAHITLLSYSKKLNRGRAVCLVMRAATRLIAAARHACREHVKKITI